MTWFCSSLFFFLFILFFPHFLHSWWILLSFSFNYIQLYLVAGCPKARHLRTNGEIQIENQCFPNTKSTSEDNPFSMFLGKVPKTSWGGGGANFPAFGRIMLNPPIFSLGGHDPPQICDFWSRLPPNFSKQKRTPPKITTRNMTKCT